MRPKDMTVISSIHVVLYRESKWWIAQCLEHDIAAQARTLPALRKELERVLTTHLILDVEKGVQPLAALPRAPERFFEMYDAASSPIEIKDDHATHSRQPRFDVIPYVQALKLRELQTA